jgi:hypothetical protein
MKKNLKTGIKEVIKKYPELSSILGEYDINCATCNGNCLMKDIFEEHNLSMKKEIELKREMMETIPPEDPFIKN